MSAVPLWRGMMHKLAYFMCCFSYGRRTYCGLQCSDHWHWPDTAIQKMVSIEHLHHVHWCRGDGPGQVPKRLSFLAL